MPLTGIGFGEMLIIGMLVLIVFGPKRLPEIARQVWKTMREFKRGMNEIQRELESAGREEPGPPPAPTAAHTAAAAAPTTAATAPTTAVTAEPVIAPPTFGSDLPEEVESQLAPPPIETAATAPAGDGEGGGEPPVATAETPSEAASGTEPDPGPED